MSMFMLYLLIKLDAIGNMFTAFLIIGIIYYITRSIWAAVTMNYYDSDNVDSTYSRETYGEPKIQKNKTNVKKISKILPIILVLWLINTMIPSTKEMAFIYI